MKLIRLAVSIPVGIATRKIVERTWVAARPGDPPRKPDDTGVQWGDAIGWAALSAAGIVAAELVTRTSAQAAFRTITGNDPPAGRPSKAARKLADAEDKADLDEV